MNVPKTAQHCTVHHIREKLIVLRVIRWANASQHYCQERAEQGVLPFEKKVTDGFPKTPKIQ